MTVQIIVSICFTVFSLLVLLLTFLLPNPQKSLARTYIRMCTGIYVSGTLLLTLISVLKPGMPDLWIWLSEIFVCAIYAASCGMVIFVTKKFEEKVKK
jgi:quinol-cytochrome oxidoreductase complex cytochrome b subunit